MKEDERVELIRGEILKRSPAGRQHAAWVNRLNKLFQKLGDRALVRVQNPVELDPTFRRTSYIFIYIYIFKETYTKNLHSRTQYQ